MRCPKCGYNSFEYNQNCPKCRRDLSPVRRQLFLVEPKPGRIDFFSLLGTGTGDVSSFKGLSEADPANDPIGEEPFLPPPPPFEPPPKPQAAPIPAPAPPTPPPPPKAHSIPTPPPVPSSDGEIEIDLADDDLDVDVAPGTTLIPGNQHQPDELVPLDDVELDDLLSTPTPLSPLSKPSTAHTQVPTPPEAEEDVDVEVTFDDDDDVPAAAATATDVELDDFDSLLEETPAPLSSDKTAVAKQGAAAPAPPAPRTHATAVATIQSALEATGDIKAPPSKGTIPSRAPGETFMVPPSSLVEANNSSGDDFEELDETDAADTLLGETDVNLDDLDDFDDETK